MNELELNCQRQQSLSQYYQSVSGGDIGGVMALLKDRIDRYLVRSEEPRKGRLKDKSGIAIALQMLFEAHVNGTANFNSDHIFR